MRSTTAHLWQRDAMPREVLAQRRELHSSGALEDLDPHSLVCPEPHRRLPQPHGLPLRGSVINSARGGGGGGRRVEEGEQQRLELARHLVLDRRAERVPVAHRVLVPQRRRLRRVAEADDLDEDILVGAPRVLARLEQLPRALGRERVAARGRRRACRHQLGPLHQLGQQRSLPSHGLAVERREVRVEAGAVHPAEGRRHRGELRGRRRLGRQQLQRLGQIAPLEAAGGLPAAAERARRLRRLQRARGRRGL
jgi:hypothetical protein